MVVLLHRFIEVAYLARLESFLFHSNARTPENGRRKISFPSKGLKLRQGDTLLGFS